MTWHWRYLWLVAALPCGLCALCVIALAADPHAAASRPADAWAVVAVLIALPAGLAGLFGWLALRRPIGGHRFGPLWAFGGECRRMSQLFEASQESRDRSFRRKFNVVVVAMGVAGFLPMLLWAGSSIYIRDNIQVPVNDFTHISAQRQRDIVDRYWNMDGTNATFSRMALAVRTAGAVSRPGDYLTKSEMETLPLDTTVYYWGSAGRGVRQYHTTLADYMSRVVAYHDKAAAVRRANPTLAWIGGNNGILAGFAAFIVMVACMFVALSVRRRQVQRFTLRHEDPQPSPVADDTALATVPST